MRCQLALMLVLLLVGAEGGISAQLPAVVVNEIMYAPSSPEPEWIELLNRGAEPVNLKKWAISDATGSRHLFPAGDIIVPPGGYLILTRDSTVLRDVRGALPCAVASVTAFPSLNNSGDAVMLFDATGHTMDSLVYLPEWGGSGGGRSLERRDADAPSTEPGTWGTCVTGSGATPGLPNSILRRLCDVSIDRAFVADGTFDTVVAVFRNAGKMPASGFRLRVYDDANLDSVAAPDEWLGQSDSCGILLPGDSVHVPLTVHLSPGFHQLITFAEYPADERPEDNWALCVMTKAFPRGSFLVNEIMADPAPGGSEYVEIVSASEHDVDMKGWSVTDLTGSEGKVLIAAASRIIHPGEFVVLSADSILFRQFPAVTRIDPRLVVVLRGGRLSLNNEGDAVVIRDALDVTIDSVMYSDSWHNPDLSDHGGRSLERISPALSSNDQHNWGTSVDASGGTPCGRNSISVAFAPGPSRLSCMPNPFSPDGDGVDDVVVIHYEMPLQTSIVNLKIYDIRGRLIRRLANNEPGGLSGNIVWDGRDEVGAVARIGIYIALLEAVNSNGGLESAKGILVLARRL
jgi:hypothetical protein